MAKSKGRDKIKLKSTESSHYYTATKKKGAEKLKIKKYDPKVRKHVLYEEGKLK